MTHFDVTLLFIFKISDHNFPLHDTSRANALFNQQQITTHMTPLELATASGHQSSPWRQRLCHVAQIGGEKEQGKYSQADEDNEAPGQDQQWVNVVPIADILRLLAVLILDQVAILHPICNFESIFTHLPSAEEWRSLQELN